MVSVTVVQQSHRDFFLEEGYLLALQFNEGWVVFRIMGCEDSQLRPWNVGMSNGVQGCAGLSNQTAYDEILDSSNRHYLEPAKYTHIKHFFWGVSPPKARIYTQYLTRVNRNSLLPIDRTITGDVGYVNGEYIIGSPYDGPFNLKTEQFTVREQWPAFMVYNPCEYTMNYVLMTFDVRTYTYQIITNQQTVQDCLTGQRRCRKHTVGGIDVPVPIPSWLENELPSGLLDFTQTVMESAS